MSYSVLLPRDQICAASAEMCHQQPQQTTKNPDDGNLLFLDATILKKKYNEERNKRVLAKQSQQHAKPPDDNVHGFFDDPFASSKVDREPLKDVSCDVVVIGGGFGGQQMAVELLKNGITDFRIIEKGSDFGGVWYWNQYPGAQCDIDSYVYMPLLEETGHMPTRKYVGGSELLDHARRIARHFELHDKALLQTEVLSIRWDDKGARWSTYTNKGDVIVSRFVVSALGPLHRPILPSLPGLGRFNGRTFHTSRWDYAYTGGSSADESPQLDKLADKRVGIIGTGATAVQIVPHLGRWAQKLYVFQRTPSSVDVRENTATDRKWADSLKSGWQRIRMDNFNEILCGQTPATDLVSDCWTKAVTRLSESNVRNASGMEGKSLTERTELLDLETMEQVRQHVEAVVKDPDTAESLKPYYRQFCKRPCWSDEYLQTFNKDNVVLIDTHGQGVERVTENGVVANGGEYEIDCLILATGFEITTPWWQRSGIDVKGRDGMPLREKWGDGPRTLYGFGTTGFPNCFFLQVAQSGLSAHFLHVLGHQAEVLSQVIRECRQSGVSTIEPTQAAEDEWVEQVVQGRERRKSFRQDCTPGYYNNDGVQSVALDRSGTFGGTALDYINILDAWKEKSGFEGFALQYEDASGTEKPENRSRAS